MNSANICDSSGGVRKCSEERLSSTETLIALLNGFLKFLTSERFANLLSINSECMKKKQLWRCIQNFKDGCNTFRLKSCTTDKYLSIDESGNVECKYDDGTDLCDFEFVSSQYTGFVHIRSFKFRLYLGGSENVTANSKAPTSGELWSIRLHTHPYINIFNVDAGLYASIKDEDNGVEMGSRLAWDPRSSLFKLEEAEKRFYVVKTGQSQKYVCNDGSLSSRLTNKSLFYIHLQKYGLTLQSCDGSYLYSSQGKFIKSKKVRKIGNEGVWRFVVPIEKVCFKFQACQKFWSLKHSNNQVAINGEDLDDAEVFQMHFPYKHSLYFHLITKENKYLWVNSEKALRSNEKSEMKDEESLFSLELQVDKTFALKSVLNACYALPKLSKHVYLESLHLGAKEKVEVYLVNREFLVINSLEGFVGISDAKLDGSIVCNRIMPQKTFVCQKSHKKFVLKTFNELYWHMQEDGVIVGRKEAGCASAFFLQLVGDSKCVILGANEKYARIGDSARFECTASHAQEAQEWNI